MPRYDARADRAMTSRITSVKLDGKELLGEQLIQAADTDEGWVDIIETELVNGKRRMKMTDWVPDPKDPTKQTRTVKTRRETGKVEVVLK